MNIQTDMISVEEQLDRYDLVIAPVMYMVKPGFAEKSKLLLRAAALSLRLSSAVS